MRTLEDAIDQFAYHPATPEVSAKYAELRARVIGLAGMTNAAVARVLPAEG